ncbi:MAG: oxidoreductase [Proteobacteria bacterium]|nr:MAG: oxidoreductase [Pseudomonadota bacterium]
MLAAAATLAACGLGAKLLPERFAVNAPLAQLLFGRGVEVAPEDELQRILRVRDGFSIGVYADGLPNARFLRFTDAGDLLVSTPRSGRVWIVERDANGDGRADAARALLEDLDRPHGLDFHEGWLYVAEGSAVRRVRYDTTTRRTLGALEAVVTGLPDGGNHWTRTVRFGPDAWMYVSIGSSCNACIEEDPRRAALLRFRPDGSEGEVHATGLRNSVGFDWQPGTGDLYATDNGRDLLGDDLPPCELNRVVQGGFYGWPFAYGDRQPDPDLGDGREREIRDSIPPAHAFGAHNAPLGITFVRNPDAPEPLRGAALVALHGSWNRTAKDGYEVVTLHWTADGRIEERSFVSGFVHEGRAIGRPVDVAEGPDGAIYVSDDYAGAVYRIAWGATAGGAAATRGETRSAPHGDALAALPLADRDAARARGRALYEGHACYRCHETERADAGAVPVVLAGLAAKYDLAALDAYLAAPQPPMPLFPLEPAARRDLAAFLLMEHGD